MRALAGDIPCQFFARRSGYGMSVLPLAHRAAAVQGDAPAQRFAPAHHRRASPLGPPPAANGWQRVVSGPSSSPAASEPVERFLVGQRCGAACRPPPPPPLPHPLAPPRAPPGGP